MKLFVLTLLAAGSIATHADSKKWDNGNRKHTFRRSTYRNDCTDSADIVDGKLKLILGLIWALILHYSISMPVWDGEDAPKPGQGQTPKQRVRAYGPGIEPKGPVVNATTNFTVETFAAGKGKVDVIVLDPRGTPLPVDLRFNNDKNLTYSVSYIPKVEGPHKVIVKFNDKEIPKSPYTVNVEGPTGDAGKVTANGPGLQPEGVSVNRPTYFDIQARGAGKGVPAVIIVDPAGQKTTVVPKLIQKGPDCWQCEYVTPHVGLHSVNVLFAGKPIPNSPFEVKVSAPSDLKNVHASGRGLQPTGVRVGDDADFKIYTNNAGEGTPVVRIIGPGGVNYNAKIQKVDATTYDVHYFPNKEGRYRVMLTFDGQEIPKSPFDVAVGPKIQSNVIAYGPGLRGGVVERPATFTVETNGNPGKLSFNVAGPSQAPITVQDNEDGSCFVSYKPKTPGDYFVHVRIDDEDIPKSPFMAKIEPKNDFHPENVKSSGPGIQPTGVQLETPAVFTVDTKAARNAHLEVKVTDCLGKEETVNITEQKDGTKKCVYVPKSALPHTVEINYGNVATPQSPYRVKVAAPINPAKVQAFGPWLEGDVKPNQPTHFNVDAREAGEAELTAQVINDETKKEIATSIIDNGNNTYSVEIESPEIGTYTTTLFYGGVKVPTTHKTAVNPPAAAPFAPKTVLPQPAPAKPVAATPADVSKVKVQGLERKVIQRAENEFCVDMTSITTTTTTTTMSSKFTRIETSRFTCKITDARGNVIQSKLTTDTNDLLKILYTPVETGRLTIDCAYDNVPLPGAPFTVDVKGGNDVTRVRAYGTGLQGGLPNQPAKFTVETKKAGAGRLSFAIEGPSEAKLNCVDNRDGTCEVSFLPSAPGEYDITVRFDDQEIPGSPFKVCIGGAGRRPQAQVVAHPTAARVPGDVKVFGPGIDDGEVRDGCPTEFYVDYSQAGAGKVGVQLKSSDGSQDLNLKIYDKGNGLFAVSYTAPKRGVTLTAHVMYADKEVKGSPFLIKVGANNDPKAVKVTGDLSKKNVPASLPVKFQVDSKQAGQGDITVSILDAEKHIIQPKIHPTGPGACDITFVPDELGPYLINVKFDGKDVSGSPFQIQAQPTGNADKCQLLDESDELEFGKQNRLTVDASNAGPGAVTCRIIKSGTNTPIDVQVIESKPRQFDILYTVHDAGEYDIDIKFGGRSVPDGVFSLNLE